MTQIGTNRRRILVISDLTHGGAAVASRRIFRSINRSEQFTAKWIAGNGLPEGGGTTVAQWPDLAGLFLQRFLIKVGAGSLAVDRAERAMRERTIRNAVRSYGADLISLHNIHEGLSFSLVEKLPRNVPIVWSMHDMWPITGYCCFSYDCERYLDGCKGECPERRRTGDLSADSAKECGIRQRFFSRNAKRLACVSPSRWMADCIRRSLGDDIRVEHISYGFDLNVFKPVGERVHHRATLGLPTQGPIVLTSAVSLTDDRKGRKYLVEAIDLLRSRYKAPLCVVAIGNTAPGESARDGWAYRGTVRDGELLNMYYNAADVFVLPSLAESFGQVFGEAIAAGTPCVCFDVAACPEIVRNGQTGFVARYKDSADLASCIERALVMNDEDKREIRAECRRVMEQEYDVSLEARRYETLFLEVLTRSARNES